jgi:hypothetical protein
MTAMKFAAWLRTTPAMLTTECFTLTIIFYLEFGFGNAVLVMPHRPKRLFAAYRWTPVNC